MERSVKLLLFCVFIFTLVFASSCSGAGAYQRSVYDDAKKISATGDSYTYISKIGSVHEDQLSFEINGFYGKDTVWEIAAEGGCTINFSVSSNIKSGKFKLCLVNNSEVTATIFEGSQNGVYPVTLSEGINRIIMVGSNAGGTVTVLLPGDIADKPVTVKPIRN